jgi:hypothetical protein
MRRLMRLAAVVGLSCAVGGIAFAGNPHVGGTTGQPSMDCAGLAHPGNAASATGSAFNDSGKAGKVYANPTSQGGTSSGNSHVVSQYDVACFQQAARVAAGHGKP